MAKCVHQQIALLFTINKALCSYLKAHNDVTYNQKAYTCNCMNFDVVSISPRPTGDCRSNEVHPSVSAVGQILLLDHILFLQLQCWSALLSLFILFLFFLLAYFIISSSKIILFFLRWFPVRSLIAVIFNTLVNTLAECQWLWGFRLRVLLTQCVNAKCGLSLSCGLS